MYQSYHLSHRDAQAMIAAVQQRLEGEGKAACIAVTDANGELLAFLRMDGCHLAPVQISVNKAFTAARERKGSGDVGQAARTGGYPLTNLGDHRITGFKGGLPVLRDGQVAGAVGVSGLTEAEDLELAELAVKQVR
jgi:glc operon protein GlcG